MGFKKIDKYNNTRSDHIDSLISLMFVITAMMFSYIWYLINIGIIQMITGVVLSI